jgi:hypothetical protein
VFTDAFKRYLVRDNHDLTSFEKCFTPVLIGMADAAYQSADPMFRSGKPLPPDAVKAVGDYLRSMHKRMDKVTAIPQMHAVDEQVGLELVKAARAITIAVYRELATAKALEVLAVQE